MSLYPEPGFIPEITLGVRLRMAREHTQLDRSAFAAKLGIHRDSLAKYETDRAVPRQPVITSWALASGVDPDWLRTGIQRQAPPTGGGNAFLYAGNVPRAGLEPATDGLRARKAA